MTNNPSPDAGCPETFRSLVREWERRDAWLKGAEDSIDRTEELAALIDAWERELQRVYISFLADEVTERMLGAKEQGR